MALLTNINGKFSVSDAGAVTFNDAFTFPTADGTANYILKTNGSGQLAWAANPDEGVTRSGTVADNRLALWKNDDEIKSTSSLFYASQYFTVGSGTGGGFAALRINADPIGELYLDFTEGSNYVKRAQIQVDTSDNITIKNTSSNTLALTIDSSQNAIFEEDVDAGNFKINGGQGSDGQVMTSTGSGVAWETPTTGTVTGSGTLNKVARWTATGSDIGDGPITFATNDSTFAGTISVASGTISVLGGNNMTLAGPASHGGISFATNSILPATAAATNNNVFDLGATAERFKNLYLGSEIISGGGATFAGTVNATGYSGPGQGLDNLLPLGVYSTTPGTAGVLIKTNIVSNNYGFIFGTINLEQFNQSTVQRIQLSATVASNGTVATKAATSDIAITMKLFHTGGYWYIHLPMPSTYVTVSAYIYTGAGYQGQAKGFNEVDTITVNPVPSGATSSVDIVADVYLTTGTSSPWLKNGNDIYNSNSGNVGIGDTSPQGKLEVNNRNTATGAAVFIKGGEDDLDPIAGQYTGLAFGYGGGDIYNNAAVLWEFTAANATGKLHFAVNPTGGDGTANLSDSKMTIIDSGFVGIGTTTPQKKVHIEGTGAASEMQILVSSASDTVGHTAGIGLRAEGGEADGDLRIKGGIFFERIAGSFGNGKMILAVNSSVSNTSVTVADHALTIDTNKNVGIGTTSPTGKVEIQKTQVDNQFDRDSFLRLHPSTTVDNGGTTNVFFGTSELNNYGVSIGGKRKGTDGTPSFAIRMLNDSVTGTEVLNIDSSGNVGIGEPNPNYKLNVASGTNTDGIYLSGLGNAMSNGEYRQLQFGYSDTDTSYGSTIRFVVPDATTHGGQIEFYTDAGPGSSSGLGALALGMLIDDNQNVGIGTTSPITKLHVSSANAVVTIEATTSGQNCSTWYKANGNNQWETGCNIGAGTDYQIYDRLNSASRMVVGHDGDVTIPGNLGIGNTSPQTTFHVGTTTTVINQFTNQIAASNFFVNGNANGGASFFQCKTAAVNINMMGNNDFACNQFTFYHKPLSTSQNVVGTIATFSSSTQYNTTSDYRLKENVIPLSDSIIRLKQLKPSRFNFIEDPERTMDGFLAHEVQNTVPEAVNGEKDAVDENGNEVHQGIDQAKIVPLLVAAVQEQQEIIESLKQRIEQLEN